MRRLGSVALLLGIGAGERLVGEDGIGDARLDEIIQRAKAILPSNTVESVPMTEDDRPFVTVASMHIHCESHKVPVGWMVRAIGGDRAVNEPLSSKWTPFYFGRNRYLLPDVMTEAGLAKLRAAYSRR